MGSWIISETSLSQMPTGWWPNTASIEIGGIESGYTFAYATMYRKHSSVQICVDFLARNIAHLGLHVYQRDKDNNRSRVREADSKAVALLKRPSGGLDSKNTQYKLFESVLSDMFISGNGFIWKQKVNGELLGLLRVPFDMVQVRGTFESTEYIISVGGKQYKVSPEDVIHFRTYNPANNVIGVSPLESLREVLAEEWQNTKYTTKFWQNAARISGVIERPAMDRDWSDEARARFAKAWAAQFSGEENSGKTAILEEGMTFKPISWSPKDTQYIEARKLSREEVARVYHIPPPLVGILDHATYSNISEQSKSLYRDVLGPICAQLEDDFNLQYLSDFPDLMDAYCEFNIEEKLQGDFEAQMDSYRVAVGVPFMTPNEARTRMNLPRIDDEEADRLVTPLNMTTPQTYREPNDGKAIEPAEMKSALDESFMPEFPWLVDEFSERWQKLLVGIFIRQREAILPKFKAAGDMDRLNVLWDKDRWDKEVTEDFLKLNRETALAFIAAMNEAMGSHYDIATMEAWLSNNARISAEYLNQSIYDQLSEAIEEENTQDALKKVFEAALAVTVARFALGKMTQLENFVEIEVVTKANIFKTKTWVTRSKNPRHEHAAINGETVPVKGMFSNGMRWPGDYKGSAEQTVNCQCKLRYNKAGGKR